MLLGLHIEFSKYWQQIPKYCINWGGMVEVGTG